MNQKGRLFVSLLLVLAFVVGTASFSLAQTTKSTRFWATGTVVDTDLTARTITIELDGASQRLVKKIGEEVVFPVIQNAQMWQCSGYGHNNYGGGLGCWGHKGYGCWNYGGGSGCGYGGGYCGCGYCGGGYGDRGKSSQLLAFDDIQPGDYVNLMGNFDSNTGKYVVGRIEVIID